MAQYQLNKGYNTEKTVDASDFKEEGSLTIFYDADNNQVFAVPTKNVHSIERVKQ